MSRHDIKHITDLLKLDEDEFFRMLPDLCLWWKAAKSLADIEGAKNTGFIWFDDGHVGFDRIEMTDPATNTVTTYSMRKP